MKKYNLTVNPRTFFGRKSKKLRAEKLIPANIFGKKIKSVAVQVAQSDFMPVYKEAGETGLVDIKLGDQNFTALIQNIQKHPTTANYLHVDFHQVDLKEKIHANVPLDFIGIAPAVSQKKGILLPLLDELEIEALPTDLPEKIIIDVSKLVDVGQSVKIGDLKLAKELTVLSKTETEIVKIGELLTKDAEKLAAEEAAAKAAAQAQTAAVIAPEAGAATAKTTPTETAATPKPQPKA